MQSATIAATTALATAVAALSVVLPAGAGRVDAAQPGDPAVFVTRVVGHIVADEYARAWQSLLPAHKRVAPRREYVTCELKSPVCQTLLATDVLRVAQRARRIPGVSERVPVTSVTLRLRVDDPAGGAEQSFTLTFSAVRSGSRWAWILTPSRYELYRSNSCA